ncbi:hypothetical protein DVA67_030455 [Solirubrobacter sp. CPCC 204708]|uniref:Uncharacterized protein n=1 Tax=Solirubrobacter deserti TaxID=2282478 RepID=A0ABT4RIA7_9ACTN|nr:hypothetical protein [Solirubrobacter deserti]MBE2320325.1 hypothetical protein [Solirubrobacter deserti]MDA0138289.1 hypothetical protein [Solirubrobacter deserti]
MLDEPPELAVRDASVAASIGRGDDRAGEIRATGIGERHLAVERHVSGVQKRVVDLACWRRVDRLSALRD